MNRSGRISDKPNFLLRYFSNLLFLLGYASTKYRSFKIKENDSIYNQGEFDKLKKLFNLHLHGAKFTITKAYAVHNPCKQT